MLYHDRDFDAVMYLFLVPPITYFMFGSKEGFVWSLFTFLAVLPILPPETMRYFVMAYIIIGLMSLLLEALRIRAEELSESSQSFSQQEHERLLAAQAELEESESRFRTYSELASDWLFEMDETLTYTFATPRLYEILGGTIEGQNVKQLSLDLDGDGAALSPMFGGEEIKDVQVSFLNFKGERVVALFSARPMLDADGNFKGYVGAGKDITAIKQAEEELRLKDQTLHHMQKLEALGQLTSGVAHDFNNLLTIISGNLDLLQNEGSTDQEVRMIQTSMRAVDRAGELTQQLLSFSRKQELEPKSLQVSDVFDRLNQMFSRTMESTIKIELDVADNVWSCLADMGQLENALLNLSLNARDAMSRKGQLTLGARNYHHKKDESQLAEGDYVRIWVQDTGCGIDEAELGRIMEPFYTTKPVGEGTGLGLSMVYGFARQSNGILEVTSEIGTGSKFSLLLPRSLAEVSDRVTNQDRELKLSGTVVVVDDDADVLSVVKLGLEKMGLKVFPFSSAEQALPEIDAIAPQVVVTDLMLGDGMNGAELADELMKKHPDLPMLIISGNPDQLLNNDEFRHHSVNLLRKPFSHDKLREAIEARLSI
jgi:PAS domain S-box-containing protein